MPIRICTLESTATHLAGCYSIKILNCTPARTMYSCEYFKPLSNRMHGPGRKCGHQLAGGNSSWCPECSTTDSKRTVKRQDSDRTVKGGKRTVPYRGRRPP